MARRQKTPDKDEVDRIRKRNRSLRNRERRKERKPKVKKDPNDLSWIRSYVVRMVAYKILSNTNRVPAPFWLSVSKEAGVDQVSFYPCRSFERGERIWYGFLFREHRDEQILLWGGRARKEFTEDARGR